VRVGRVIDAVDRGQQRVPIIGFPLAVFYKYLDDQGNYLAAIIAYYAFIAIFPLLLLGTSILGFILQDNPTLQERILDSALSQFPIIGDELGRPEGLQGSTTGLVVGSIVALYGALGLGQAIQNALNQAWAIPRDSRPNPVLLRLRSLMLLVTAGVALLGLSIASALLSSTEVFGEFASYRWPIVIVTVLLVTGVLALLLRLGAARTHQLRTVLPGALAIALMWQSLQSIGTAYVKGVIAEAEGMDSTFAVVLGLIGLLWVAAVMGVLGMEVNVVLARRLWPRALLTIITDNVNLTDADKRAYASYARMQRHKGYEDITVVWGERRAKPQRRPEPPEEYDAPAAVEEPDVPEPTRPIVADGRSVDTP
jgi:YihY family inner membrane protein